MILMRESMTTILQWRPKGSPDLDESRDWKVQMVFRSQTLEGLLEKFDRMSLRSLGQTHQPEWPRLILSQLTLTFPPRWDCIPTHAA